MRLPLEWLREYVDFEDSAEGLASRLTFSGIEVEGVERIGSAHDGLVVGEVRAVARHPNADRLTVCRVFDGTQELQVVCGAPNVRAGGRYPLARVGVKLANGTAIKAAKLRGVESHGMLCAEDELGISDRHDGLLELAGEPAAGTPLADVLGGPETVLDLEITPNRPDCLCILGVAREVAALYGRPLRRPAVNLVEGGEPVAGLASVDVRDAGLCPRYTARVITGLRVAPSPLTIQRRLTHAGVRPINNLVDVTNYVMLECGHPLHAFDYARIEGRRIVVRRAADGERMATLDGVERALNSAMLLICDDRRPVAVAGVMGGAGSEVGAETTVVLLEAAAFQPAGVRATARALGLTTESSYRFARGVDPAGVEWASRRAAALLAEWGGGTCARGLIDRYPEPVAERTVACRPQIFGRLLGLPCEPDDVRRTLASIGLAAADRADGTWAVTVPTFRGDLRREEDLVEEYVRLSGLDRIPVAVPRARLVPGANDRRARAVESVRRRLTGLGLTEFLNYSLTSPALLDRFDPGDTAQRIRMPHPLSEEQSVLRTALIPQLMEALGRNRAHQVGEAAAFEIGRVFALASGAPREAAHVAIGLLGPAGRGELDKRAAQTPQETFRWLKGVVADVLRGAGAWALAAETYPAFAPGQGFQLTIGGAPAGRLGLLRADLAAHWRIYEPVALAELDLDPLLAGVFRVPQPRPPPAHPSSARDVAFLTDERTRHEDVLAVIRRAAPPELEDARLFDVYQGPGVGDGRKSLAYSLTYRAAGRTLTDEDVNAYHQAIVAALVNELRVEIRDA